MAGYQDNTTNAAFIPTIIAQKALGYFGAYMNLARTVGRDFDWTPATYGKVIQIPKRGLLVANSKASNANVVVQNPTATNTSVTLNNHYEVTFGIDNVTQVLENQNVLIGYGEDAAKVLGENVEGALAASYAGLTNAAITFDATSATTIDNSLRLIRKYFTDQKVAKGEDRHIQVSSGVYNALLSVPQYVQAQNLGLQGHIDQTPIVTGSMLNVYGMNIWESQLMTSTGTTPSIVDHNIAYTENAFVLASRPLPSVPAGYGAVSEVLASEDTGIGFRVVSSFNPTQLAMQVTLDVLYGVAVNDVRRGVEVDFTHA
jgi:hypothetical protein